MKWKRNNRFVSSASAPIFSKSDSKLPSKTRLIWPGGSTRSVPTAMKGRRPRPGKLNSCKKRAGCFYGGTEPFLGNPVRKGGKTESWQDRIMSALGYDSVLP